MSAALALSGRWLAEYWRRPLNVVLLIAVPVVFVTLSAGALSDFADILGGGTDVGEFEAATAGWAAAVLAGVAEFFHVSQSVTPTDVSPQREPAQPGLWHRDWRRR